MRISLFKKLLRFPAAAAICVVLLGACGGPQVAPDRAAFNDAVVTFNNITTDTPSLTAAELAFTDFIATYPNSNLVDDAYYYIARSIHERAKLAQSSLDPTTAATASALFTDARTRYADATTIPPTSNKADNAQLQIGKTYYDETTLANNYTLALNKFSEVLTTFPTSSIADDAQYYIGRTKHEQALLAQIAVSPTPTAATLFTDARDAYGLVISNYPTSTRRDDAQYQIGRTYYDLTIPDYTQAITEFNLVFANYNPPSAPASAGDDARYYLGRSKHEQASLAETVAPGLGAPLFTAARADYSLVITDYPLSNRRDDAEYQIGKTYYDVPIPIASDYSTALGHFQTVIDTYCVTVIASACDDAQYYIGRTKHEQALLAQIAVSPTPTAATLFNEARDAYGLVISNYPTSTRRDDAQYQIGRTFYDVAVPNATDYSTALGHFQTVIDTYCVTVIASACDDAQYYIGRSKHGIALLPALPPASAPAYTLTDARIEYNLVLSNYCTGSVPLSVRCDDARYQVGRTYFDVAIPLAADYSTALVHFQAVISIYGTTASAADDAQFYIGRTIHQGALLGIPPSPAYTLANARTEYGVFASPTTPYPLSIRLDDAAFYSALTFHDAKDCLGEKNAMTIFVGNFSALVSPIFNADALVHLDGIAKGNGGHSKC